MPKQMERDPEKSACWDCDGFSALWPHLMINGTRSPASLKALESWERASVVAVEDHRGLFIQTIFFSWVNT